MQGNKFLGILAGSIVGFLLGFTFYIWPAKCLVLGPIENGNIPQELQNQLITISLIYGGIPGIIIGILGNFSVPITMPRGHMSKSISCTCFLVCTIIVFVKHGGFLFDMSAGRIMMLAFYEFMLLLFAVPIGGAVSFIEAIRE